MAAPLVPAVGLRGRLPVPASPLRAGGEAAFAVCRTCHGPAPGRHRTCWSCALAERQLGRLPKVDPVFLFRLGSPVHGALVGYKAGASPAGRAARAAALAELLAVFLDHHAACVLGPEGRALVVPVPSSSGGRRSWKGRHPLEGVCRRALEGLPSLSTGAALCPSPLPPRRHEARAGGFEPAPGWRLDGLTVLVVDDVFVSGARALSAAAALAAAGAAVAAVVPLGRLVRPGHNEATAAFWACQSRLPFEAEVCARCAPPARPARVSAWPSPAAGVSERLAA